MPETPNTQIRNCSHSLCPQKAKINPQQLKVPYLLVYVQDTHGFPEGEISKTFHLNPSIRCSEYRTHLDFEKSEKVRPIHEKIRYLE